jgi:thiosulfate reductase cytochrome b subunit
MSEAKIYLYPVYIRIWHLGNAIFCLLLILTGISMQFSNPNVPLIRFSLAVSVHNVVGILLTVSYFIFFIGNLFSGNGIYYRMTLRGLYIRLKTQFVYYTKGIFKNELPPFPVTKDSKFNPLQQFTYVGTMYFLVPVVFITGWAMMYPDVFIPTKVINFSGLHLTDLFHIIAGFLISLFMFIHIYFCTIGKTPVSNFKGMIDGYHEAH